MMGEIAINLGEVPEEGLRLAGETARDIFELPETETDARPAGPVRYDLWIAEAGTGLMLAQGTLRATFRLRCVACLEEFSHTVDWGEYVAEFDAPAGGVLDLTDRVREDLLLELPAYPHCDRDGDETGRVCPATGKFDAPPPPPTEGEGNAGSGVWSALDGLK